MALKGIFHIWVEMVRWFKFKQTYANKCDFTNSEIGLTNLKQLILVAFGHCKMVAVKKKHAKLIEDRMKMR
jgi:hypothetical protein